MKSRIHIALIAIIFLAIAGTAWLVVEKKSAPGKYDTLAACIAESGATFYGAFWCPHCQNQKAMVGKSASLLPYYECSTPDGRGQIEACNVLGITTYPTWVFADGSTTTGEVPLDVLAKKTECNLPEAMTVK